MTTSPNPADVNGNGRLTQNVRVVMQPSTNDRCQGAAVRFTDKNGNVYTVNVISEAPNVTAVISTSGAWRFTAGVTYQLAIIDTAAGNVAVGGVEHDLVPSFVSGIMVGERTQASPGR